MKVLKFTFKLILWLVVILIVALLALPLWIGPVAKGVANSVVPGITGTTFNLGEFGLNQYAGTVHVGDVQLGNPPEFKEKNALELGKFDAKILMASIFSGKKYVVDSVVLDGITIYSDATASNFRQIADNATKGKESAEEPAAETKPEAEKPAAEEPAAEKKKGKGIQINHIVVDNVTVKLGPVPMKVPMKIELEGIGADSEEGVSLDEAVQIVYAKILSAVGVVGTALGDMGKGAIGAVTNVNLSAAADALNAGDMKGAKKVFKDAGKDIKNAFKADKAKDALKEAGNNLKDLFK